MPLLSYEQLHDLALRLVLAMDVPADEAPLVAGGVARANLAGHDSHGLIRLEQYARMVREGQIVPGAPTAVVHEKAGAALLDGGWNFGQVVATRAVELGIRKARECGTATVCVRHANHLGRLGEYTLMAAEQGFVALGGVNNHGRGVLVAPFGGSDGRLATNPISIASPGADHPLLLDITTSVVAEGKVRIKRNAGLPTPEGWLINNRGESTTDPADLYTEPRGAILPFGGSVAHKGYGLAVMVDVLSGALSGGGCSRGSTARLGNAMWFTLIDVESFVPLSEFRALVEPMVRHIKASPLAPGFTEILMPGELELREEERRRREGIAIDEETWRGVVTTAEGLGVDIGVP